MQKIAFKRLYALTLSISIMLSFFVGLPAANAQSAVIADNPILQTQFFEYTILPDSAVRSTHQHLSWGIERMRTNIYAEQLNRSNHPQTPVTIAVIDSGLDIHHSFFGSNILPGINTVQGESDTLVHDRNGHGTAMTGIIADVVHGIEGIRILPIKALDNWGRGEGRWISDAIDAAIAQNVDIINMSLGWTIRHPNPETGFAGNLSEIEIIENAVRRATNRGITVVVAAGNESSNTALHTPSRMDNVITVAAVDSNDNRASFSNFGAHVDVAAPGVRVIAPFTNQRFASSSGTSPATAHVSAIAAMYLLNDSTLTASQLRNKIRTHVDSLGGWNVYTGAGIPNLTNAPVQGLNEPTPSPTNPPSPRHDFNDIEGHWAEEATLYLIEAGIVSGIPTGHGNYVIEPDSNVTRAQFIRMMAMLSGDDIYTNFRSTPATDIHITSWHAPYFIWAANIRLVEGYDDGTLRPDELISRQEIAVILARFVDIKEMPTPNINLNAWGNSTANRLHDDALIAPWAHQAFLLMRHMQIINGDHYGNGRPTSTASRAESMTMIWNLIQK